MVVMSLHHMKVSRHIAGSMRREGIKMASLCGTTRPHETTVAMSITMSGINSVT